MEGCSRSGWGGLGHLVRSHWRSLDDFSDQVVQFEWFMCCLGPAVSSACNLGVTLEREKDPAMVELRWLCLFRALARSAASG